MINIFFEIIIYFKENLTKSQWTKKAEISGNRMNNKKIGVVYRESLKELP